MRGSGEGEEVTDVGASAELAQGATRLGKRFVTKRSVTHTACAFESRSSSPRTTPILCSTLSVPCTHGRHSVCPFNTVRTAFAYHSSPLVRINNKQCNLPHNKSHPCRKSCTNKQKEAPAAVSCCCMYHFSARTNNRYSTGEGAESACLCLRRRE